MYEKEMKRILDASQNNSLSFFVGAGISKLSGLPTWPELTKAFCKKMKIEHDENFSSEDMVQIPQKYFYSIGRNEKEYNSFVRGLLDKKGSGPNEIHHRMLKLNPVSFITTNFDTLIEDAAVERCQGFKVISHDKDVPHINGDRFILKLHGDFKYNNFVLKDEDYLNYGENFKLIETIAKSIFSTNTVVFLGYKLNDYNIRSILNWTKSLLKSDFIEPIFVYADRIPLTKSDLTYHESRGLSVLELNKLSTSEVDDYWPRYRSLFSSLEEFKKVFRADIKEDDAFDTVYNLLSPLDKLDALRVEDLSRRLASTVIIDGRGAICTIPEKRIYLKKFINICQISISDREKLCKDDLRKFYCLLRVFRKARITHCIDGNNEISFFPNDVHIGDRSCILFKYKTLNKFVSKEYKTSKKNYRKAFYLSCLKRYREALDVFLEVSKEAFKSGNYLLHYIAVANCIELREMISRNPLTRDEDCKINVRDLNDNEIENLFLHLPVSFRNKYKGFNNIHRTDMLLKFSYEAFITGNKLRKSLDNEYKEAGFTSSRQVICKIYNYLHFFLGNGLIAIESSVFKNTTKNLMSLLIYKYSAQSKEKLIEEPWPFEDNDLIEFDEVDFYCFIKCFTKDELLLLFKKYHIRTIKFQNMSLIESAVRNLLDYYDLIANSSIDKMSLNDLEDHINTCLTLLWHVNISQRLVDNVSTFILTHEFRSIWIDDKILFLQHQICERKKHSNVIEKMAEETLISYIDKHIEAINKNEAFELPKRHENIDYCDLIDYTLPEGKGRVSNRIAKRIFQILSNNLTPLYSDIFECYYRYLSSEEINELISWTNNKLKENFDFSLFTLLIKCDVRVNKKTIEQLKTFLRNKVKSETNDSASNRAKPFYVCNPFEELDHVGYWCFIKSIDVTEFKEFLGLSAEFDFFCEYEKFDFSRFDISWLLRYTPTTLKKIAQNESVRNNIRTVVAQKIQHKEIADHHKHRIQDVIFKYFL